ncbi:dihydrolipoamide acetyltransferase family protein [Mesorhizobium sp. 1B3]|uniref:dihydrolipoamide acetyltransferase family protein n=1 Tax=Mesorhizobium sp. 1B3 TaxID=3243599 RepID=UPI003D977A21
MTDICMPQLGESVTEGTITTWLKSPGETVEIDESICEVATDKVTFEVPSPQAGTLAEVLAPEGSVVPVNAVIARLASEGNSTALPPTPRRDQETAQVAVPGLTPASEEKPTRPAMLSPLVRRLAKAANLDPSTVLGSGYNGRVTRDDILKAISTQTADPAPRSPTPQPPGMAAVSKLAPTPFRPVPGDGDTIMPFTLARQKTAEHMVYSVHTSPHGFISSEVDYGAIDAVRKQRKDAFKTAYGVSLTYLPFVIRALTLAVRQFPLVNSAIDGNNLIVRKNINIGVAVDLSYQGLMVPVIRDADGLNLVGIARSIADLAMRARSNKLKPEEMSGGTFTVTNPGPSGTHLSIPIINQPQVAIMVTDGVHKKPSVVSLPDGSETVSVRPKGFVGLSMDHRAFDGAYAADFLSTVKRQLEDRDWDGEF